MNVYVFGRAIPFYELGKSLTAGGTATFLGNFGSETQCCSLRHNLLCFQHCPKNCILVVDMRCTCTATLRLRNNCSWNHCKRLHGTPTTYVVQQLYSWNEVRLVQSLSVTKSVEDVNVESSQLFSCIFTHILNKNSI